MLMSFFLYTPSLFWYSSFFSPLSPPLFQAKAPKQNPPPFPLPFPSIPLIIFNANQFNSLPFTLLLSLSPMNHPLPSLSSLSANPLFSSFITLSTLTLLYFPHILFKLILSPLIISTSFLLISLLCFGSRTHRIIQETEHTHLENGTRDEITQNTSSGKSQNEESRSGSGYELGSEVSEKQSIIQETEYIHLENGARDEITRNLSSGQSLNPKSRSGLGSGSGSDVSKKQSIILETENTAAENATHDEIHFISSSGQSPNPKSRYGTGSDLESEISCSFIQWDVTAPLEVIYEGEEGGNDGVSKTEEMIPVASIVRYPSLSRYYPETDSDSEEEGTEIEFPDTGGWRFRWQDEEEKDDGLIEIEFDCEGKRVEVEDDSFIDIDFLR